MSDDFVSVECMYLCQARIVTGCGRQSVVVVCISVWLEVGSGSQNLNFTTAI